MLAWINERFQAVPEVPAAQRSQPPVTVKEFVAAKKPSTAMERMTCLVYWATAVEGKAAATTRRVNDLNRLAGGKSFSDAGSIGQSIVASKGYVSHTRPGLWTLSEIGKAVVLALPDRAAVAALSPASG